MPKSIPTLGDSNWGTPLNNHLSQLQNPTTGGINSFEQFSLRPTNLTTDDIGKTYLYTQTGNIHQWNGNGWKVLNESVINVKDYGAVGDGVVDDTFAVQSAIDSIIAPNPIYPGPGNTGNPTEIFFPVGVYLINIITKRCTTSIKGAGNNATYLKSFTANGYAIQIGYNDTWNKMKIEQLSFLGDSGLTRGGIRFGDDLSTPFNPVQPQSFIGGLVLQKCTFRDLNIGIYKPWGNIGNHISDCSFYKCNYHIRAIGYTNQMYPQLYNHPGDDIIDNCHFQLSNFACIYFDGNGAGFGNYIIRECTFESNLGVAIMAKNPNTVSDHGGFLIQSSWFEDQDINYPTTPKVTIDSIIYNKTFIIAQDINININDCKLLSSHLTRSNFYYTNCTHPPGGTPSQVITKDISSSVIVDTIRLTGDFFTTDFLVKDFIYEQLPLAINYTLAVRTKPRSVISHSTNNVLSSESFANKDSYNIDGQLGNVNTQSLNSVVKDGLLFDRCLEINNLPNQVGWLDNDILINITPNKYILWSLDARLVSGDSFSFSIAANGNVFGNDVIVTSKNWCSYIGVGYSKTANLVTSLGVKKSLNTIARISAFQCLAFDNLQDMMDYIESGIFSTKQSLLSSSSNTPPTTGTYNQGDLIYNANPTPGGYVGWICTASGTPGTWKGFGLIES